MKTEVEVVRGNWTSKAFCFDELPPSSLSGQVTEEETSWVSSLRFRARGPRRKQSQVAARTRLELVRSVVPAATVA